ncbi:MAG: U32 family peptidase [Proteobacteria bacterium]|nr:U32 family peptidase [Pseudomonadota bacterium]
MQNAPVRRSELLMPAGSLERLKVAVLYGADAIYMGTPDMSMRTKSQLTLEDIKEGISFAHARNVRVYLALNIFTHNKDILKLDAYIDTLKEVRPDGVIVSDPGVFHYLREYAPEFNIHISTQANVCSWMTVKFWKDQGAELIVMAREVTFSELEEIREKCTDVRLETFVHGAMCMTYSGRCLLSNFMAERGANQGNCANSCRWQYKVRLRLNDGTIKELELSEENMKLFEFVLEEGHRPGDLMPIEEDDRGSYILNSKDLCLMPKLNDYLRIGVDSLKIEGRGKSPYYLATTARAYRRAIDDYYEDPDVWDYRLYMRELEMTGNRGYTLAFHEGRVTNYAHNYENTNSVAAWEFGGIVRSATEDALIMEVKNKLRSGDVLEFIPPNSKDEPVLLRLYEFEVLGMDGPQEVIHGGPECKIRIPLSAFDRESSEDILRKFPEFTVVRKESLLTDEEWERIRLDQLTQKIELGRSSPERYGDAVQRLKNTISIETLNKRAKTTSKGLRGCCGRGCNGCLMFWNDAKYETARALMKGKKSGEMLTQNMRDDVIEARAAIRR